MTLETFLPSYSFVDAPQPAASSLYIFHNADIIDAFTAVFAIADVFKVVGYILLTVKIIREIGRASCRERV